MNKSVFKIILLLSIFTGIVSGVLTIVPYAGEIVFWLLITIAAPLIILFLTKMEVLEISTVRQSAVIGGLIGFVSFLAFCAVYIPAVIVLAKFFNYSVNPGVSMFLTNATFGLMIMLAVFMGILSATINAFSGFVTYYLIEFNKSITQPKQNSFDRYDLRKQR